MKVLFLDIDGVLHGVMQNCEGRWIIGEPLNKANRLAEVLQGHTVSVIISSTWRFDGLDSLIEMLPSLAPWISGVTTLDKNDNRFLEIIDYVEKNSISDWRALDDDYLPFGGHSKLIACDPSTGLQEDQLNAIQNWLNLVE